MSRPQILPPVAPEHPAALRRSRPKLFIEFWVIVRKDQSQLNTITEYWFTNNYDSLVKPARRSRASSRTNGAGPHPAQPDDDRSTEPGPGPSAERAAQAQALDAQLRARVEEKIAEKAEERIKVILLDMILPTGKMLRESTRKELLELGGFVRRVAERLLPGQTVEAAGLSEMQLRELYAPVAA